jgi:hypothetical protein
MKPHAILYVQSVQVASTRSRHSRSWPTEINDAKSEHEVEIREIKLTGAMPLGIWGA